MISIRLKQRILLFVMIRIFFRYKSATCAKEGWNITLNSVYEDVYYGYVEVTVNTDDQSKYVSDDSLIKVAFSSIVNNKSGIIAVVKGNVTTADNLKLQAKLTREVITIGQYKTNALDIIRFGDYDSEKSPSI